MGVLGTVHTGSELDHDQAAHVAADDPVLRASPYRCIRGGFLSLQWFSERLNLSENRDISHRRSAISKSKRLKAHR
jgi:hypothetical protein